MIISKTIDGNRKLYFTIDEKNKDQILNIAAMIMSGYGKHEGRPTDFGFEHQFADHCLNLATQLVSSHELKLFYSFGREEEVY